MSVLRKVKSRYLHAEEGGMLILGIMFFVALLFCMSLAVDVARYENERIRVQGIADRAVLAAANMRRVGDGDLSPVEHVRAYFAAEGFSQAEIDNLTIIAEVGPNGRNISVWPQATMSTYLMQLIGVNTLQMATPSRAEVGGTAALEVVMVLDISWSMTAMTSNGQTRIENLRTAASNMVEDLFIDRAEGDIAITLVPYESWVVPPPGLVEQFDRVDTDLLAVHRGQPQHCIEFTDWDNLLGFIGNGNRGYLNVRSPALPNALRNVLQTRVARRNCGPLYGHRIVRPLMTDRDAIISTIQSLEPMGTTSIDLGVRFGAMFFADDLNSFIRDRIDAGQISPTMTNRPAGPDDPGVLRVMVVMTDGENCCGARAAPAVQDQRTLAVCDNLKAEGVLVYAVAFEAPPRGRDLMQACASSDSHFFNTNGSGLRGTFEAIGRQINAQALRLTL